MRLAASASALAVWAASRSRSRSSLGPLLGGDVPADLRGPDDLALGVADGRDGERDVDDGAVLPPPPRLVVVHLLAAADPLQDPRHVLDQLGRHEHGDVLADDLLGGVAEDPLGPPVPARDDAVEVLRGDDVVGRLDDGREPLVQLRGPPLLRDVAEDEDDARDVARGRSTMGAALSSIGVSLPSRAMSTVWFARPDDRGPWRGPSRPGSRRAAGSVSLTMRKTSRSGLPTASACGTAAERLRDRVQERDVAPRVGGYHRVADARRGPPASVAAAGGIPPPAASAR